LSFIAFLLNSLSGRRSGRHHVNAPISSSQAMMTAAVFSTAAGAVLVVVGLGADAEDHQAALGANGERRNGCRCRLK
jgi:hypothetical protein